MTDALTLKKFILTNVFNFQCDIKAFASDLFQNSCMCLLIITIIIVWRHIIKMGTFSTTEKIEKKKKLNENPPLCMS